MPEPELTVAIPTMRRWSFLEKNLPVYLEHPFIRKVLICDETGEDIEAILSSKWAEHPKLILKKNEKRLGIYYNKRQCIEISPTEWVAVLDSDNFFEDTFFYELQTLWRREGANPNHFYASGRGIFIHEDGGITNPINGFGGFKLDKTNWNDIFNVPRWNYMLNDGNWVVHRSVLSCLPTDVLDEDILATDAIFMAKRFVQAGFVYNIREELSYIHSVHKGSSWIQQGDENNRIWNSTNWKI
jgi:hypothetical protein